ncbi:phosphatidylinositol alpha-mannosyltransferase [Murinocardiopsis flavida]|uniref:Phosphatidylinositol alpha-mannosyltransferase n=1 Tax=Murinocardiopsis flavida TaxID=645275 RepID=A0A2P8DKC1_9ACTN|nr:glycosyltransferase family 4 protein [Murinocardiopsis flavida]PSK97670.1 phosphatidylinositol alpha-mannosyltransferase [Murinocardiopsis flavida]
MRVGLVCPYAWDVPGGVQQHIGDLAEELLAAGHEVSVLAPCASEEGLPPHVVSAGGAVAVPYNGSVARLSFGPRAASRVRRWIRTGGFDVLHVHEPIAPSLAILACWAAEGPIAATFHTANTRSRAMAVSAGLLRTALEKVNGRIAVSEAARATLVGHLGGDAVLIPNGVAVRRYENSEPWPGWPGDGGVLGFLGRMDEPRKGLGVLLDAFNLLGRSRPGLRLLLAGPGEPAGVLARVDPDLRGRVLTTGRLSEADKVRAYRSVDVFCAPNLGGESFGMVLTEAMAAGAAVLASDIPAFQQVLGWGSAGALFRTGDPAALAHAAAELLDAPGRREALSRAARLAVGRYDWRLVAADVADVYETISPAGSGGVRVRADTGPRLPRAS